MLYLDIQYIFLQENVQAGLQTPPIDLVSHLIHDVKLKYSAATLLGTTIMSVKFSFLFFFRDLVRQQKKLMRWWRCTLFLQIPAAPVMMFSNLMSCPYTDERITGQHPCLA